MKSWGSSTGGGDRCVHVAKGSPKARTRVRLFGVIT
ncbi:hypothetical protein FNH06_14425 [Amycolatopsis acidiphila]|uniref:Uncharacterized protein n=1 Tax=Amycolatopsis acidiphila TaxID=715473 RepID=A0A558AD15_9PSEU|nr:hypothetical protein FNH06_14425 [Amycolatopsis acidiphila]